MAYEYTDNFYVNTKREQVPIMSCIHTDENFEMRKIKKEEEVDNDDEEEEINRSYSNWHWLVYLNVSNALFV